MRQPNAKNCSSVRNRDSSRNTLPENTKPIGAPSCGNMPVPRALAGRRVLGRQQHGAAPLTAKTEALAEAAQRQQQRRRDADRLVGRQHADQHRRHAHRQQRRHERGLAADAIAEVAEQRPSRSAAR